MLSKGVMFYSDVCPHSLNHKTGVLSIFLCTDRTNDGITMLFTFYKNINVFTSFFFRC